MTKYHGCDTKGHVHIYFFYTHCFVKVSKQNFQNKKLTNNYNSQNVIWLLSLVNGKGNKKVIQIMDI